MIIYSCPRNPWLDWTGDIAFDATTSTGGIVRYGESEGCTYYVVKNLDRWITAHQSLAIQVITRLDGRSPLSRINILQLLLADGDLAAKVLQRQRVGSQNEFIYPTLRLIKSIKALSASIADFGCLLFHIFAIQHLASWFNHVSMIDVQGLYHNRSISSIATSVEWILISTMRHWLPMSTDEGTFGDGCLLLRWRVSSCGRTGVERVLVDVICIMRVRANV